MNRPKLKDEAILTAISNLKIKIEIALRKKGNGCFASSHEILGVITEEYYELIEAVYNCSKLPDKEKKEWITGELLDIAVGCIIGVASINDVDWL